MLFATRGRKCDGKTCKSPREDQDFYTLVYHENHLRTQKFDCGCISYSNAYYSELSFHPLVWDDFFSTKLSPGEKLVKLVVNRSK